jgi:hypothetical protein
MRPLPIGEGPPTDGGAAAIMASNWRPIRRNTLIGSTDLYVRKWRFTFYGAPWHRKGEREWISLPAKEWTGPDYTALGKFSSHDDTRRFSEAAIAAIKLIGTTEPHHQAPAVQRKLPGVAASSRRRGLYARPRRAEGGCHLPDDDIAGLWREGPAP